MNTNNKKKTYAIVVYIISYACAILAAFSVFNLLNTRLNNMILTLLICDVTATLVIYLIGLLYNTASIYDPYWSLQSFVIGVGLLIYYKHFDLGVIILLSIVGLYSIRLTYNFIKGVEDITYIDWRYQMLKEKTKKWYFLVNLFGIHLFPTIIVFMSTLPLISYIMNKTTFSPFDIIGYVVMLSGIFIEMFSDMDIHKYKEERKNKNEIINVGLWKVSRHPNYFGEILFWYGLMLTFTLHDLNYWYYMFAPISINLMFIFISIPLQEKRLMSYKRNYKSYKNKTRMLVPMKKRIIK